MKGSTTFFALVLIGAAGAWIASQDRPTAANKDAAPVPAALVSNSGSSTSLRYAGTVLWTGAGLNGGAMSVYCAPGSLVFGHYNGQTFALNGYSMTRSRTGYIALADGGRRTALSADATNLQAASAIITDADPMIYNRKTDEGLRIGVEKCGA